MKSNSYNLHGLRTTIDILAWFKQEEEQGRVPKTISILAKVFLAKPFSSALQERVFSTGGVIMGEKRTSTDDERAEKMLILAHNDKLDNIVNLKLYKLKTSSDK